MKFILLWGMNTWPDFAFRQKGVNFAWLHKTYRLSRIAVNKRKIINDPVYGFISFPYASNYNIIEHPLMQRLRRIRQLGLTNLVYPGANHTRFQHALGAGYLMSQAIDTIRSKGTEITEEESEAVINAILLHDIGHGPFSHSLENSLVGGVNHEELSLLIMKAINLEMNGRLDLAIKIFSGHHPKKFLHQLVSGQLDMDRLDYLKRDSFFTGVTEGVIGSDRIIKMLNVKNDELVVDIKGIYSIEKFLIARRLMYWQVYLHKTVVAAETILIQLLRRARKLSVAGEELFSSPALQWFLKSGISESRDKNEEKTRLDMFTELDDNDIYSAARVWTGHHDPILKYLCLSLINRRLPRIEISREPFPEKRINDLQAKIIRKYPFAKDHTDYFIRSGQLENKMYSTDNENIKIAKKDDSIQDISEASDIINYNVLSRSIKKYYLSYPKEI